MINRRMAEALRPGDVLHFVSDGVWAQDCRFEGGRLHLNVVRVRGRMVPRADWKEFAVDTDCQLPSYSEVNLWTGYLFHREEDCPLLADPIAAACQQKV